MKLRAVSLICILFIIQLLASCCDEKEYYDFTEMTAVVSENQIAENENLTIELRAGELEFLSCNFASFGFTEALATSCENGTKGMKYPFTEITVTSDADFTEDYPAASDLRPLFLVNRYTAEGEYQFVGLDQVDLAEISSNVMSLYLSQSPAIDLQHSFSIKLTKSNGDTIDLTTEPVNW